MVWFALTLAIRLHKTLPFRYRPKPCGNSVIFL